MIPCVNPDGVEIQIHGSEAAGKYRTLVEKACSGDTFHWQANARGVDINHNFDADWDRLHELENANGIDSPAPTRYGGNYPESEPESRAVASLCRAGRFSHAVAFHTASALARVSGYSLSAPEGLASGGGFKDWFCQTMQSPGFTIELGKGTNPLPVTDLDSIYAKVREMLILAFLL